MMAGGSSGQLHIWNLLNDQEVQRVEGHQGKQNTPCMSCPPPLSAALLLRPTSIQYYYIATYEQDLKFSRVLRSNSLRGCLAGRADCCNWRRG